MKRLIILFALILALIAGSWADGSETALAIPTFGLCLDGLDNDGDGKIDQSVGSAHPSIPDPQCDSPYDNTEWRVEHFPWECYDFIDQDFDPNRSWEMDGQDPDCTTGDNWHEYPDEPDCSNGIDDDGDGTVDWADDPTLEWFTVRDEMCMSPVDNDELRNPEVCSDGLDNDGDGKIDFGPDPGCYSNEDTDEGDVAACANGVDDDGDSLADSADPGCEVPWDPDEQNTVLEPGETVEELTAEGDVDLTCYVSLGDHCPTFAFSASTMAAAAGPVYLHACRVRTTRPIYSLNNILDPEGGSVMHGIASYGCNVPMRSVRICGQLFRNTFVDSPTFIAAGPFTCTLQFAQTGGVFGTVYQCIFYGFPNHSRTWFMNINVVVTFPSGNTQTQQWRTSRTSAQCH